MSLLTLETDYKPYLKITSSENDIMLDGIANAVESRVKNFLGRDLEAADYTEYYSGDGDNVLSLKQFPVNSVASIKYYDGLDINNAEIWTALAQGTDYERLVIIDTHSIFLDGAAFSEGIQNWEVVYNAGYESGTAPAEIYLACKELFALYYNSSPLKMNTIGLQSFVANAGSGNENSTIDLEAEQRILNKIHHLKSLNV